MSYVPINDYIYSYAFSGAMAALSSSAAGSGQASSVSAIYAFYTEVAGAFAQAIDTTWDDASLPNAAEISNLEVSCLLVFQDRNWQSENDGELILRSNWNKIAAAIVAEILQADLYLLEQGIAPPSPITGDVTNVTGVAPITSTGGAAPAIGITAATESAAGSMSAADKTKLDGLTPGAAVASVTGTAPIVSSGGDNPAISITAATESAAGSMSATDKVKLDNLGVANQNLVWYEATAIFIDPQNTSGEASDSNAGTSAQFPLLTWNEVIRRYGTVSPILPYGQSLVITFLSSQTAGTDPINFTPFVSGGGIVVLTAQTAWVAAGAAFTLSATPTGGFGFSGAAASAGGTAMQLTSMPSYVAKGVLLYNSTRQSYAFVDSMNSTTATVTQPQTSATLLSTATAPSITADNDWASGDSITAYTLPNLNLKTFSPQGGDENASSQGCSGWIIGASIADPSGTGASVYPLENLSAYNVLTLCLFAGRVHVSTVGGRGFAAYLCGCMVETALLVNDGEAEVFGGSITGPSSLYGQLEVTNNALLHGSYSGYSMVVASGGVFSDGTFSVTEGNITIIGTFWGSYAVTVNPGGLVYNDTGSTWVLEAALTTGALKFGTLTTGARSVGGKFVDGISITPANLDKYGGLQDLAMGGRFCPAQASANFSLATWLAVTAIYWDPGNSSGLASDGNAGTSNTTPVLTWAEVIARYGGTEPVLPYGQSVTVTMMSAQPAGQDPVNFEPYISNGARAILNAQTGWVAAGSNFTLSATPTGGYGFSGAAASAGGSEMTVTSMPAYVVKGSLLQNTTRGSYAFVDSITGTTAKLTQPQTTATLAPVAGTPNPTADNDWANGDTIEVWTLPNLNLKRWRPKGTDKSSAGALCGGWVFGVSIADSSGAGGSQYAHGCASCVNVLSTCYFSATVQLSSENGYIGIGTYLLGCMLVNQTYIEGGTSGVYGGSMGAGVEHFGGSPEYYNNAIIHGTYYQYAGLTFAESIFSDGTINVEGSSTWQADGIIWGSYAVTVSPGGIYWNDTGSTFTLKALLTTGTLRIGANATGWAFVTGATGNPFTSGISITPANLDTYVGLQDPATGARFCNTT